jgi:predicted kinase
MTTPDVIVIRGAPGSGKSEAAKRLAARLGTGARIEVDTLRSMIVPVDWTNQAEHIGVLSLATGLVAGFLRLGHRPVIVVDTFSGDKLTRFLADLRALRTGIELRVFALVPDRSVLRARVEGRPDDGFKIIPICEKLNADVARRLVPGERLIDNSTLTPDETVDVILGCGKPE